MSTNEKLERNDDDLQTLLREMKEGNISWESVMQRIAEQREKTETSEGLIPIIHRLRRLALKENNVTLAVQLWQEEFLSAQHMIMEKMDNKFIQFLRGVAGVILLINATSGMSDYINDERVDPDVRNRIHRFRGKLFGYLHNYQNEQNEYEKGISYFGTLTDPSRRCLGIELEGFRALSQMKQGRYDEGMAEIKRVIEEMKTSSEGMWLHDKSYQTWAVWLSGFYINTAKIIFTLKHKEYDADVMIMLTEAEKILRDERYIEEFEIRQGELADVWKKRSGEMSV
jgi:hypothetical protein